MSRWIIELEHEKDKIDTRDYFLCIAEDLNHAEEQALDAYPESYLLRAYKEV